MMKNRDIRVFIGTVVGILVLTVVSVSGATITVDDSGGADYLTIQAAIDNANVGDTIEVRSGTYYEHVNVNKQHILWGVDTGGGKPVVDASGSGSAITLSADGIILNGFTATNAGGWGIEVMSSNNTLTNNTASNNNNHGIFLSVSRNNNTLTNNTISNNNNHGIYLSVSSNNTLSGNTISNNSYYGIYLFSSSNNNTLSSNIFTNDGLAVYDSYKNNIVNNTVNNKILAYFENKSDIIIQNAGQVILVNSSNITVEGLNLSNTSIGVELWNTNDCKIINNTASNNSFYGEGITLYYSSNNTLTNNTASNNYYGIRMEHSSTNNTLSGNIDSNNNWGIVLYSSSNNNTLSGNIASNNNWGISLYSSSNNTLTNNNIASNNEDGIRLHSSSNNNTLNSNTVLSNSNYGIYLKSSSNNNTLINNTALDNGVGISLSDSSSNTLTSSNNNTLINNTASNNNDGIVMYYSSSNTLNGNNASNNSYYGIFMVYSSNNMLSDNNASNNTRGIELYYSSDNTLSSNIFTNNNYRGIYLKSSSSNIISNNYFYNTNNFFFDQTVYSNNWNITKTSGTNIIGGPYLGGNFWANPSGTGFSQTCIDTNVDGICDATYTLESLNIDYLPLAAPDTTKPIITILSPIQNNKYNTDSVNLTYTVSELTISEWYSLDGGNNISLSGNTTLDELLDGNHNVTVYANDSAGNIGSAMVNFSIDTTTPTITIDLPQEGYNYSTSTVALNVTADESIVTWKYSINGTANVTFTPNTTLSSLPDGNHNVTVYANDSVGNIGSALVNFSIDTTKPIITIATPTASSKAYKSGGQEMYVNFTYIEANPNNYTILIRNATDIINSTTAAITSSPVNMSFTMNATAADGYYNVTVTMWDNASNTNTSTEVDAVSMDTTPPTAPTNLTHTDDAPSGYDNDNITDISWSAATDGSSSVIYCIYRDGVLNGSTTSLAYIFTNETEGSHTYNVSANDSVGNINTTNVSVTVIVDYTNPVIHNLSLSDTSPSYGQQIIVSVNVTDTNLANVTAGSTLLTYQSGILWNGTITASYGTNSVTVTAYDNASNSATNSSLSYTGPAAPTTSTSGGGGGGSGSSGEEYEKIEVKDVVREQVIIDEETSYEFKEESNAIETIKFTALKNAGEIFATIEVLKGRSALVKSDPPGKVYQNMNIWVGTSGFATPNNIADVKVGFKVEKSWIEENDIVVSTIRLCRHHDDVWNPLPTKKSGEDDKYIYFEAKTPGFSPFSITGSTEEEVVAQGSAVESMSTAVPEQIGAQSPNEGEDLVDDGEEEQDDEGASKVWFVVGALVVILIGGSVYWMYRIKNDEVAKERT